ncbi:GNAT family N-acetyltransferase [Planctomyces sp. SH-PL62]|uniref:GNAT family N-acetyltransferase n=1 Tax=Planctomyces sp. SH-PL62 TaxID=1636152 RepID=UPI00078B3432|nr:GNAT family N-acetyltransferase [Planctomyces sp. SH-PL62]AMV37169.1 putative acetyltransferase [Planctomyces sp. SH-PL62]
MIHFRPFRNPDPPALLKLWNAAVPESVAARPLRVHELDDQAFNPVIFDPRGLIVAERDGRPVGFVHAGFGPDETHPELPFHLDHDLGVVSMLAAEPGDEEAAVAQALVVEAERYLRSKGAKVLYGGGRFPLNPFYWGIYGGSEASGVPSSHNRFSSALSSLGYEPIGTAVHLHFDLTRPDPRDPRAAILRRQLNLQFDEDHLPTSWWENIALGDFHPIYASLRSRDDGAEVARAKTWDMSAFGRVDGRARLGVFDVEVAATHRRNGYGRFLMGEVVREARERGFQVVEVQTLAENEPALAFYQALDFEPVEQSTVFRLPAPFPDRSRP